MTVKELLGVPNTTEPCLRSARMALFGIGAATKFALRVPESLVEVCGGRKENVEMALSVPVALAVVAPPSLGNAIHLHLSVKHQTRTRESSSSTTVSDVWGLQTFAVDSAFGNLEVSSL